MRLELPVQCPRQRQKAHFRTNFPSKTDSIPKKEVRRLIRLIRICTDDVLDFCKSMYIDYIYIFIYRFYMVLFLCHSSMLEIQCRKVEVLGWQQVFFQPDQFQGLTQEMNLKLLPRWEATRLCF